MNFTTEHKLHLIAKKMNQLNNSGKVKAFTSNERGYAKIAQIKKGCSVWIRHLKTDELVIALMSTSASQKNYSEVVTQAQRKFKDYAGERLTYGKFQHAITDKDQREHLSFDVTNNSYDEIDEIIGTLLKIYA